MTEPKTVKVRIAVAVDRTGDWSALGSMVLDDETMMTLNGARLEGGQARYWLTAELPLPEVVEIDAEVSSE